jgi:mannosyltransferase
LAEDVAHRDKRENPKQIIIRMSYLNPSQGTTLELPTMSKVLVRAKRLLDENIRIALWLGFLMIIVTLLSILALSNQSLRLDEAQSLWQTSNSVPRLLMIVGGDVHVPFYHLLLHFWQVLLGNDVAIARMFSLFFFLLTIPVVYLLGYKTYGTTLGLFAATLVAVSPFLNWYGNEIRMYSLLTLLTVANQYFFIHLYQPEQQLHSVRHRRLPLAWLGYGITALLGIFTHYFFWFVLITQAIFYFAKPELFAKTALRRLLVLAGILIIAFLPWLYFVQQIGQSGNSQPNLSAPSTVNLFNTFSQFVFGFQNDHLNTLIVSLWPISVLLGFLTLSKQRKISADTLYFFLSAIVPIVLAFLVSITIRPLYLTRYLIFTVPSLFLFLGWVFSTYHQRLAFALKTVLLGGMIITLAHQTISAETPVKENFREASSYMSTHAEPQDIIIVSAPFTIYPLEYYYTGAAAMVTLPEWNRYQIGTIPAFSEELMINQINKLKTSHERAWVILSYDQGYQEKIRLYFETNFQRLEEKVFSPGLTVYLYKLRYTDTATTTSGL